MNNIIKKISLSLMVAAGLACFSSCSSGIEEGLYPGENVERTLLLKDASDVNTSIGSSLQFVASGGKKVVAVVSDTRWVAEVKESEGQWCSVADASGIGKGQFTIVVAENPSKVQRECLVEVFVADGAGNRLPYESRQVRIRQGASNIVVSPTSPVEIPANGISGLEFTVTTDEPWQLDCNDWTHVSMYDGSQLIYANGKWGANGSASFKIAVERNGERSERVALLTVSSPTGAFIPYEIELIQKRSADVFEVDCPLRVVAADGGSVIFSIFSPIDDWEAVSNYAWVSFTPQRGAASADFRNVEVSFEANRDAYAREATIVFKSSSGQYQTFGVMQPGSYAMPAVSTPWVEDGWTANVAELCCSYLMPDVEIIDAVFVVKPVGSTVWMTYSAYLDATGDEYGVARAVADGLEAETDYEFHVEIAYRSADGVTHASGSPTVTFRTPKAFPANSDNNPPK